MEQYFEQRIMYYEFLKTVFQSPLTESALKIWKDNFTPEIRNNLSAGNDDLLAFFSEIDGINLMQIVDRENSEYNRLFNILNDESRVLAPPWESVYVTNDGTMFGKPVFQIREKLHEFNLQFKHENKEPEDHIATELEFMAYLIAYSLRAFKEKNESDFLKGIYNQYWLVNNHLLQFINEFKNKIISNTESTLYKGAAELLVTFIKDEHKYLQELKEVTK